MKLKKFILTIIFYVILIPFFVNAEICNSDQITIDSVTIKEKTNKVTEFEQPIIEGKKIKINLKMMEIGDSIEYKLLLKNDSKEDYELDKNSFNSSSDYIEYRLNTDNDSLVIKAGKTKEAYLKIQYKTAVQDSDFDDGKFSDNKSFALSLSNQETTDILGIINNPKTGKSLLIIIIIIILCLGITLYLYLNKKNHNKIMILVLGLLMIIPVSVCALCKVEVVIDSNVVIEKDTEPKYEVAYLFSGIGVYTDEELAKYQTTSDTKCEVKYIEETKYNYCNSIIIKDEAKYAAGESVYLKTQNIKTKAKTPTVSEIIDRTIDKWWYDELSNNDVFTYLPDDKDVMNFNNYIDDHWDLEGYFCVNAQQSFTMPNHDVLFNSNKKLR